MKKMITFLMMVVMTVQFGLARDVITMNPKELPVAAQTFLKQYFENRQISYIKVESEFLSKKYYSNNDRLKSQRYFMLDHVFGRK